MVKIDGIQKNIFKRGSLTYYYSSRFFPPLIRKDVTSLYAFVRVIDDFVDLKPQQKDAFFAFRKDYREAIKGRDSINPLIQDFVELARRKDFDPAWTEAFFDSMEADLNKKAYHSMEELLCYTFGSAEVIGLFMHKILNLPPQAIESARALGRAMQYINFIRDIDEDYSLGRRYLPLLEDLTHLSREEAKRNPLAFHRFIQTHGQFFLQTLQQARIGFNYLPPKVIAPVATAAELYEWTCRRIMKKPLLVWKKKLKPTLFRVIMTYIKNRLTKHRRIV